jgi:hypothetical protein
VNSTPEPPATARRLKAGWTAIPSDLFQNREVRSLTPNAKVMLVGMWLYSNRTLCDGRLTPSDLRMVAAESDISAAEIRTTVAELVTVNRLALHGEDVEVMDVSDYNWKKSEREDRQKKTNAKVAAWRAKQDAPITKDHSPSTNVTINHLPGEPGYEPGSVTGYRERGSLDLMELKHLAGLRAGASESEETYEDAGLSVLMEHGYGGADPLTSAWRDHVNNGQNLPGLRTRAG